MKLGIFNQHVSGYWWKGFQSQRSKIKVIASRLDAMLTPIRLRHGLKAKMTGDSHENLVNSIAWTAERDLNKPHPSIFTYVVGRRTDYAFNVVGLKVTETFAHGGIQIDGSPSKTILCDLNLFVWKKSKQIPYILPCVNKSS